MDITIGVTVRDEDDREEAERMLLRHVMDLPYVQSTLVLRPYPIGSSHLHDSGIGYRPDESTRRNR